MSDLISRSALIELLKSHDDITLDRFSELAVIRLIKEQPTAYDVEKVVEIVRVDCYTMGFDESQTEIIVEDIRKGGIDE